MVTWKDIRYGDQSNHTDERERQTEKVCVSVCVCAHRGLYGQPMRVVNLLGESEAGRENEKTSGSQRRRFL